MIGDMYISITSHFFRVNDQIKIITSLNSTDKQRKNNIRTPLFLASDLNGLSYFDYKGFIS